MSKLIGKISPTEKNPTTCDDFQFWISDDTILSPFDIVKVPNKYDNSITYGVVQDILHITDSAGHISNYVSSDFGDAESEPMTRRLSLSYAKVSVIHNTNENYMPLQEGQPVYTSDEDDIKIALGLDAISLESAIPAGLMKASNNINVSIPYNGEFLIGPEGAHLNVSGISGLATKTSYIMFLLKAIQYKFNEDVAIIIMNVKGDSMNSSTLPIIIHYHGNNFEFPKEITEFQVGNVIFTKSGSALCKSIDYKEEREGFFEQYCTPMWKQQIANSEKVQQ